jgi:hypothetical protein
MVAKFEGDVSLTRTNSELILVVNCLPLQLIMTLGEHDGDLIAETLEDDQSHGIVFGLGESPISWNYGRLVKKANTRVTLFD